MGNIYPPEGYIFSTREPMDSNNRKNVRDLVMGLGGDPDFRKLVGRNSHEANLQVLRDNGFEVVEDETPTPPTPPAPRNTKK